jgi:AcrR family transcriptional regulator
VATEHRRAALVAAAAQCFADRPFDEVSVEDIATAAGVAKGLLFYYFKSKRGCYLAVIEDFQRRLLAVADVPRQGSVTDLMAVMLDRYLDFAEHNEPAYRLVMSGGLGNDPLARAFIDEHRARYRTLFTELFVPDQPETPVLRMSFQGFLSFVEGATLDWLTHREVTREQLAAVILDAARAVLATAARVDRSLRVNPELLD